MKISLYLVLLSLICTSVCAQRKLPQKSKEERRVEQQVSKRQKDASRQSAADLRWDPRQLPAKSKGVPEVSAWHSGTAGIVASDAAEINLFNPSRIGFSKKTELLFRLAEEPFLPNVGLKHAWWRNRRFALASEHTLYYPYPGLKMLQSNGFKELVPDSVRIGQGVAMRNEIQFSWLMNPQEWGCPMPAPEKILTMRLGSEFYLAFDDREVSAFDYAHALYHTQTLEGKVLYYGGLQFDSYFSHRFHYSLNALFYSVDLKKDYAVEGNVRFAYYVSRRIGISAACKVAYMKLEKDAEWGYVPLLDLTYLVNPDRGAIRHGLYKHKRRKK